jgi:hypothetical protein
VVVVARLRSGELRRWRHSLTRTACGEQVDVLKQVEEVADQLKDRGIKDKKEFASEKLAGLQLGAFQLPLEPSIRLGAIEVSQFPLATLLGDR